MWRCLPGCEEWLSGPSRGRLSAPRGSDRPHQERLDAKFRCSGSDVFEPVACLSALAITVGKAGANPDVALDLTAANFRCGVTAWKGKAKIEGKNLLYAIYLVISMTTPLVRSP